MAKHELPQHLLTYLLSAPQKQTKNTYSSHDPAFPYLLLFFLFLTSLAWSFAYAEPSFSNIVRIALTFTTVHCLLSSVTIATFMYFFVDRALGPGGWLTGRPGSGRRRGLFSNVGAQGESELEFGFCFDVSVSSIQLRIALKSTDILTLGCNPCLLPYLGISLCLTIHPHAGCSITPLHLDLGLESVTSSCTGA